MKKLSPGKGLHIQLTDDVADWLSDVAYAVYEAFGSSAAYIRTGEIAQELRSRLPDDWVYSQDSYGHKMTIAYELENGSELRVAVVVRPGTGSVHLDIRSWYDPEEA